MTNTYKKYLDEYFDQLLYYRHISGRINQILQKEIAGYSEDKAEVHFASAHIISDWTGLTDNGWEINFYTGQVAETTKEKYEIEINKVLSKQHCLLYAQSFEAFERFVKDCLFNRITQDELLKEYTIFLIPLANRALFDREKMPGGANLFKVLKKAGGETFIKYNLNNNVNIRFKELWTILSEVRHSITHNGSLIESELIEKTAHHKEIFNFLFDSMEISPNRLLIELDNKKFNRLVKRFSEFAYQIFKILSIEEYQDWKISD